MSVIVVGAGVVGLAAAWRLASRGVDVVVVDPDPGHGASHAAAGMLAPMSEVQYGETPLLDLCLESNHRWTRFALDLEAAAGTTVGYRREGTVAVAFDADDRAALRELEDYQRGLGLTVETLTGRDCRRLEPLLSPAVAGGSLVREDTSVDNRRLVAALLEAGRRSGARMVRDAVERLETSGGQVSGVRLTSGEEIAASTVVLAAGAHAQALAATVDVHLPVRPVKGEILRLRAPRHLDPVITRTVRATVVGRPVYLVPRSYGEVVVGATSYEQGFDTTVSAGGVHQLLHDARAVVPAVDELELVESIAQLRPGTPDNAPLVGETSVSGLVVATGHYRSGILLAPVTSDAVVDLVTTGRVDSDIAPFTPARFAPDRTAREEAATWT